MVVPSLERSPSPSPSLNASYIHEHGGMKQETLNDAMGLMLLANLVNAEQAQSQVPMSI